MAYSDTYIANHQDKLLRLGDVWAAKQVGVGSRNQEVVRVASRRWEELVSKGYRVVNPAHRHHRNTVLGISKVLAMTMPGYALAHEAVNNPGVLYHVTNTAKVAKIEKQGLKTFQTTNWAKAAGGRYGEGQVFAFDNELDAIRWAGKIDWEFNKGMGTGKISIITLNRGDQKWEVDESDPLSQFSNHGKWWKTHQPVPASQIVSSEPVTSAMVRKLTAMKNPVEGLTYTTWGAVVLMKERAKEYGEPGMVAVIPESTANMAWDKAQMAETKMARVQAGVPRMALEVFGVVDRPRVYGYAPEKWVDEFSAKVGEKQERDQHERVAASEKEAVKAWGQFVDEYNRIGRKYMEKLEAVVVRYETAARTAIEDLRAGYGVPQSVKRDVQHTGGAVLSKIGAAGTTAGSALMGLAKAVKSFVNAVTATPELTPLEPGWEKWVDRPETGMRKRKRRR